MLEEALARGWENLIGRWGGPMSFRFLVQPAMALLFAVYAGLRDARQGEPPFLWALFSNPDARKARLHQIWRDVGMVFLIALILDSIYQVYVHAAIYTLELLITATVLAIVPYVLSRGIVTRIARWTGTGNGSANSKRNQEGSEK
ncbi:MAG: hypothetical protein ACKVP0_01825 [Pirellulaceae bacterium]